MISRPELSAFNPNLPTCDRLEVKYTNRIYIC
jgi:hypothetical protein